MIRRPAMHPSIRSIHTARTLLAILALAVGSGACDTLLTEAPDVADLFDGPLDGLTPEELAAFVTGDEQFGFSFTPSTGLGPIFNDVACAACHSGDGRGRPEQALTRISRKWLSEPAGTLCM